MNSVKEDNTPKKFKVPVGDKIAYVEVISLTNHICAVEFPGHEPLFITKIRSQNNRLCWVSIPQGDDELAQAIGKYIDEHLWLKV